MLEYYTQIKFHGGSKSNSTMFRHATTYPTAHGNSAYRLAAGIMASYKTSKYA